jgi:hypothetical protein
LEVVAIIKRWTCNLQKRDNPALERSDGSRQKLKDKLRDDGLKRRVETWRRRSAFGLTQPHDVKSDD